MHAVPDHTESSRVRTLVLALQRRAPPDAVRLLFPEEDALVGEVLGRLDPVFARQLFNRLPAERRQRLLEALPADLGEQWRFNQHWPDDSVGRLMEKPVAVFPPGQTVQEVIGEIRRLADAEVFTYAYVVDLDGRLQGVVVMRDLLLAAPGQTLDEIMLRDPFRFRPETPVVDAAREVLHRHYPVYPVCDGQDRLIGLVHGYLLFELYSIEISAQPGRMVGLVDEEHLDSRFTTSLRLRHPWLQLNLLTAFLAAAVVGVFESTIAQIVALAVFLPVLAGQSGNTGCQALAVTLRGLTLKEFRPGMTGRLLRREALLGLTNGLLVGLTAALGMYLYASGTGAPAPLTLALIVLCALTGSCVASGLTGVLVPLTLKRLGADPATASSIFLTTATDVVSMGLLLGLATLTVL